MEYKCLNVSCTSFYAPDNVQTYEKLCDIFDMKYIYCFNKYFILRLQLFNWNINGLLCEKYIIHYYVSEQPDPFEAPDYSRLEALSSTSINVTIGPISSGQNGVIVMYALYYAEMDLTGIVRFICLHQKS